jgi:hypothetical protein
MGDFTFELICADCLATRGLLDSEQLPTFCPACGARDPWKGPFAPERFAHERGDQLAESPFYLAAIGRPESPPPQTE